MKAKPKSVKVFVFGREVKIYDALKDANLFELYRASEIFEAGIKIERQKPDVIIYDFSTIQNVHALMACWYLRRSEPELARAIMIAILPEGAKLETPDGFDKAFPAELGADVVVKFIKKSFFG